MELENWGVDVNELKEIETSRYFVGLTEDWERVKMKVHRAVNKPLFANKYKYMCSILPDTGHMYYIRAEDVDMVGLYMLMFPE